MTRKPKGSSGQNPGESCFFPVSFDPRAHAVVLLHLEEKGTSPGAMRVAVPRPWSLKTVSPGPLAKLKKWLIPVLGQKMSKMNLEILPFQRVKEAVKDHWSCGKITHELMEDT